MSPEERARRLRAFVRPHIHYEDDYYLEAAGDAEDWDDLEELSIQIAASYGVELPPELLPDSIDQQVGQG